VLSHHHNHIVKPDKHNQNKILIAALITASYMFVEIVGQLDRTGGRWCAHDDRCFGLRNGLVGILLEPKTCD